MIAGSYDIHSKGKDLFRYASGNAKTGCRVLTVSDNDIDLEALPEIGKQSF